VLAKFRLRRFGNGGGKAQPWPIEMSIVGIQQSHVKK
jgi:hypothetical protein